ncbi:hypothetical protein BKA69DRAFT_1121118 [Paraphysoderma sedebokerense]|nr:hypothetical protein BKA69DRAFT_1121118 [Paraphysoderma sedebokerense]
MIGNLATWLKRKTIEQPVIVASFVIGAVGPLMVVTVPPMRRRFGWEPASQPPMSYPMPNRPRNPPAGFEDDE